MKLQRKLYLSILVLMPMVLSGVMGVGVTRWLAAEIESEVLTKDLRTEENRLEVLRASQQVEQERRGIPSLPEDPGVAEFLAQIEKAVGISGISCDEVTVPNQQDPGRQCYKIGGKGKAGQIVQFLALLESDPRIPIVEELRVFATEEGRTCFELDLVLFHKIGGHGR